MLKKRDRAFECLPHFVVATTAALPSPALIEELLKRVMPFLSVEYTAAQAVAARLLASAMANTVTASAPRPRLRSSGNSVRC